MTTIKLRGGTAAEWAEANPVLAAREPGVETDTSRQKIGDGVTPWTDLPYFLTDVAADVKFVSRVTPQVGQEVDTRLLTASPDAPGSADFVVTVGQKIFNGTPNPTMFVGYNVDAATGAVIEPGEPGMCEGIESKFDDGSGEPKMEWYGGQFVNPDLSYRRPFFVQANRVTGHLSAVEIAAPHGGAISFQDEAKSRNFGRIGYGGTPDSSRLDVGFGAVSEAFSIVSVARNQHRILVNGRPIAFFHSNPQGGQAGPSFSVGDYIDNMATASFSVGDADPTTTCVRARGRTGQRGDLLTIDDHASRKHFRVTAGHATKRASVVVGFATLATTATDGFFYIPTCDGPPTGVPTSYPGTVPLVFDTVNSRLNVYTDGAWRMMLAL